MNTLLEMSRASIEAIRAEAQAIRRRQRKKLRFVLVARSRINVMYDGHEIGHIKYEDGGRVLLVGDDGATEHLPATAIGDGSHRLSDFFIEHCTWL